MDTDGSASRRYDQASYQPAHGVIPISRASSGSSGPERFRHTHIQMPPTPTSVVGPTAGTRGSGTASYGYTQGQQPYAPQLQDSSLQYRTDYTQDAQRQQQQQQQQPQPPQPHPHQQQHSHQQQQPEPQQQSQQFPTYSSNLIYNMHPQIQQQSAEYDVQQFQPRQSTAIEVLSNQFNVQPYSYTAEAATGTGPSQQQSYTATTPFQTQGQYQSSQNRSSVSPYTSGNLDYQQMAVTTLMDQQESSQQGRRASEDPFMGYLEQLRVTFRETQQGRLVDAGRHLLQLSEWISNQANDLGLTRDEPEVYQERLDFWNKFNTCWLAVLQKQKDTYQDMIDTGQPIRAPYSLLQEDFLERMGRELVRMCDGLERHGLVDYQMGVWEEEIMNILLECIELLENDPEEIESSSVPKSRASR